jgi:hypothetical protein
MQGKLDFYQWQSVEANRVSPASTLKNKTKSVIFSSTIYIYMLAVEAIR